MLDLIENTEVRAVTMDAIANKAGVSKVTLYRRWPSKAALMTDALLSRLAEAIPLDPAKEPLAAITEHVTSLSAALNGQIGRLFRSVAAECMAEPEAMALLRDRYIGMRRRVAIQIISRGLRDGSFTTSNRAVDCHDALYGSLFYRFLFELGTMGPASIDKLLAATLQARPARIPATPKDG